MTIHDFINLRNFRAWILAALKWIYISRARYHVWYSLLWFPLWIKFKIKFQNIFLETQSSILIAYINQIFITPYIFYLLVCVFFFKIHKYCMVLWYNLNNFIFTFLNFNFIDIFWEFKLGNCHNYLLVEIYQIITSRN